jgi:two-component system, NarL family, captular synthesis response regulator RcsB
VRIAIADAHEVVRIGLRTLLQHCGEGYEVAGEASNGSELLGMLAGSRCDIVITDFMMPSNDAAFDGMVLLRELRKRHPRLPIVVLTMLHNLALFRAMYLEGVRAVVEKSSGSDELISALRTIRTGRTYFGKHNREHLLNYGLTVDVPENHQEAEKKLSAREVEVMRLFVQGLTISEIARIEHRSIKTISRQKHSAMLKLGITNDRQLFEYARIRGLW